MKAAVEAAIAAAMARRAEALPGEARQWLLQRLETRAAAAPAAAATASVEVRPSTALAALAELVDRLGRAPVAARAGAPAPLKAVAAFQPTWARLRTERRLRQAMDQVPTKAGPLNSAHLVHRTLQALHRLSPAYLEAFMAHVDTLLWLEQAREAALAAPAARETVRRR